MAAPVNATPQVDLHPLLHNFHVDVKMFGAIGDGTTDDTTAVAAAISAVPATGGVVYVPPGVYKITSTLNLKRYLTIVGAGASSVLLHNVSAGNPLLKGDTLGGPTGVTIRDMTIGSPIGEAIVCTGTGHGIHLTAGAGGNNGYHIENVGFNDLQGSASWAVFNQNCLETQIVRCMVRRCRGGGVQFKDNSNCSVITDTLMSNNGFGALGGVLIDPAEQCIIRGTVIEAFRGSYGVKINNATDTIVDGCWFEDNYLDSILLTGTDTSATKILNTRIMLGNAGGGTTSAIRFSSTRVLQFLAMGNDIRDQVVLATDPGAANVACYLFAGNNYSGGTIDSTALVSTRDILVRIGERGFPFQVIMSGINQAQPLGELGLADMYIEMLERGDPAAPATNNARLYAKDNGAGKTQIVARFPTGGLVVIATEP